MENVKILTIESNLDENDMAILKQYAKLLSKVKYSRAAGFSTRLADLYIQKLFIDGFVEVKDHYGNKEADKFLFNTICTRLKMEHDRSFNSFKIDREGCTITLLNDR